MHHDVLCVALFTKSAGSFANSCKIKVVRSTFSSIQALEMSSPAPKSPEQSEKSKKYDRQLRLWGDHGQGLLESANICLLNATAIGCEILKGLVLPGVGSFIIADSKVVTVEDLGSNFFIDANFIGQSKAAACAQLLRELNPDVNGDFVEESPEYILSNRPTFFNSFDMVIASNLNEDTLLRLSRILWDSKIPFLYCRSLGFLGSIRLQIKEHCVIEAHPDNKAPDLRIDNQFPGLKEYLEQTEITSKVPWPLVLNKYLQKWKVENDGRIPSNHKEKTSLRSMIRAGMTGDHENYEEAIKGVNTVFGGGTVPSTLRAIFDDAACVNLTKESNNFWIMAKALKDFVQLDNNNLLPLTGVLPDMTADTESYIKLQNIYRQQALQDSDNVYRRYQNYLKDLGLSEDYSAEKTVRLFCREAAGLGVIRGTRIADEYEKISRLQPLIDDLGAEGSLIEVYIALRAYERFLTECGHVPGECFVENDTSRLKVVATKLLADCGAHTSVSDDMIHEICRSGGAEIHSISAFVGGCAAQEVIKIVTKQYKPIDNTFMYNGTTSETTTLNL